MKGNFTSKRRERKSRRITIRATPAEENAIRQQAAARNLKLSKHLISRGRGDGVSVNWVTRAEWRQVAISCEAYGQLLVVAIAQARAMPDPRSGELLEELVAHSGRNQARLESLLDGINARLLQREAELAEKLDITSTGEKSP
jgi:hypothetical protein